MPNDHWQACYIGPSKLVLRLKLPVKYQPRNWEPENPPFRSCLGIPQRLMAFQLNKSDTDIPADIDIKSCIQTDLTASHMHNRPDAAHEKPSDLEITSVPLDFFDQLSQDRITSFVCICPRVEQTKLITKEFITCRKCGVLYPVSFSHLAKNSLSRGTAKNMKFHSSNSPQSLDVICSDTFISKIRGISPTLYNYSVEKLYQLLPLPSVIEEMRSFHEGSVDTELTFNPLTSDSWFTASLLDAVLFRLALAYPDIAFMPCSFAAFELPSANKDPSQLSSFVPLDVLGRRTLLPSAEVRKQAEQDSNGPEWYDPLPTSWCPVRGSVTCSYTTAEECAKAFKEDQQLLNCGENSQSNSLESTQDIESIGELADAANKQNDIVRENSRFLNIPQVSSCKLNSHKQETAMNVSSSIASEARSVPQTRSGSIRLMTQNEGSGSTAPLGMVSESSQGTSTHPIGLCEEGPVAGSNGHHSSSSFPENPPINAQVPVHTPTFPHPGGVEGTQKQVSTPMFSIDSVPLQYKCLLALHIIRLRQWIAHNTVHSQVLSFAWHTLVGYSSLFPVSTLEPIILTFLSDLNLRQKIEQLPPVISPSSLLTLLPSLGATKAWTGLSLKDSVTGHAAQFTPSFTVQMLSTDSPATETANRQLESHNVLETKQDLDRSDLQTQKSVPPIITVPTHTASSALTSDNDSKSNVSSRYGARNPPWEGKLTSKAEQELPPSLSSSLPDIRPLVFFVNISNIHWNVIRVISWPVARIEIYEPMGKQERRRGGVSFRTLPVALTNWLDVVSPIEGGWQSRSVSAIPFPHQGNGWDCGVASLLYAEKLGMGMEAETIASTTCQEEITAYRGLVSNVLASFAPAHKIALSRVSKASTNKLL